MKKFMTMTAASALILGAAACSQGENTQYGDANYDNAPAETTETVETADTNMDGDMDAIVVADNDTMTTDNVETAYLTSGELSADELIGAAIIGSDGEKVAVVDDFLLADDGTVQSLIFKAGALNDAIGDKSALPYDQFQLAMDEDADPRFTISMTDEAMENVTEFEQDGLNDYRLASEIIGTTANFINSDDSIRINDIILTDAGKASYAIVGDLGQDERQIAFNRVNIEQGDGGKIIIDASEADIEAMPVFEYSEMTATTDSTMTTDDGIEADMDIDSDMELDADKEKTDY